MAKEGGMALMLDLGKKPAESEEDGSAGAEDEALSDFFSMGKSGDIAGAKDALKTFLEICYPTISEMHGGEYEEGETSEEV